MSKARMALAGIGLLACTATWGAPAPADVVGSIQATIPSTHITAVETTPLDGVYEVTAGTNIFYMQPGKKLLLVGHLFDLTSTTDLTQPKVDALQAKASGVKWGELPTVGRITAGDKAGKRSLAAFLDPDCPYCKAAYRALKDAKGVQVHYLMLPLDGLHPGTRDKSANVLCAADPATALSKAMAGMAVGHGVDTCLAQAGKDMDAVAAYATAHGIQGTPYFVTSDGKVMPGFGDALTQWLQGDSK
jgi:thiol:disulfide interchange protein DsbC